LLKVGDIDVKDAEFGARFRELYAGKPTGTPLPIVVQRAGQTLTLAGRVAYAPGAPRITEEPAASARATRLRNGILRGTTDR
jgi:hypothetical protein